MSPIKARKEDNIMLNLTQSLKGDILTLTIDLSKVGPASSTGKSLKIASTEGNVSVDGRPDFMLGLNVYLPIPKEAREAAKAKK
jgi:hypothetical protein